MTARAIVVGALMKLPMRKTSSKGTTYLLATIREGTGHDALFWSAFVFSETAIAEIEQLQIGEPVSVAGAFAAEIYKPDGKEPRVTYKIMVDGVLQVRRPSRQSKSKVEESKHQQREPQRPGGDLDDDIPF
jgi:hypothetical protein